MIHKIIFSLSMVFLLILLSCASDEGLKETSHPYKDTATEHEYPFTEVMGDYHVNLIVEHAYSTMFLKTTDIHENPNKLPRRKRTGY